MIYIYHSRWWRVSPSHLCAASLVQSVSEVQLLTLIWKSKQAVLAGLGKWAAKQVQLPRTSTHMISHWLIVHKPFHIHRLKYTGVLQPPTCFSCTMHLSSLSLTVGAGGAADERAVGLVDARIVHQSHLTHSPIATGIAISYIQRRSIWMSTPVPFDTSAWCARSLWRKRLKIMWLLVIGLGQRGESSGQFMLATWPIISGYYRVTFMIFN